MKRSTGKKEKLMNPLHVWKLIRGGNLIFIALTQYLFRYFVIDENLLINGVFYSDNASQTADFLFLLIVLSTVFIAAAGYIINNIHDVKSDKINKPSQMIVGVFITEKSATQVYHVLNIIGVLLSFIAFNFLGKPSLTAATLLVSMMLYLYAVKHKCNGLLGNVFIAFSTSMVVILVWLFEYYRLVIGGANYLLDDAGFQTILVGYIGFSFIFTLLREWAKDMEDLEGDRQVGCRHFMAKRSPKQANLVLVIGSIFAGSFVMVFQYFLFQYFPNHNLFNAVFITVPLILLINIVPIALKAKEKMDYSKLSSTYKLLMAAGIFYMLLIIFNN